MWALGEFTVVQGMRALDLGCGAGRDTRALVAAGFDEVVAVDKYPLAETYVARNIAPEDSPRLTFLPGAYQDAFPAGSFDLINAQLTLTHNTRDVFDEVMHTIRQRLKPGGLFVGNFFGDRHPYNRPGESLTFLTREEVSVLFASMKYLRLDEHEEEGPEPYAGEPWHWFDVVIKNSLADNERHPA